MVMIKSVEMFVDFSIALLIGIYNFYFVNTVLETLDSVLPIYKSILQYVTGATSIFVFIYIIFRTRKMYFDSQQSKYESLKLKRELEDKR
jgi:uncharacterized membrane protein YpjA